jgi:hypothetical protein
MGPDGCRQLSRSQGQVSYLDWSSADTVEKCDRLLCGTLTEALNIGNLLAISFKANASLGNLRPADKVQN